jgi:hypothetical protein
LVVVDVLSRVVNSKDGPGTLLGHQLPVACFEAQKQLGVGDGNGAPVHRFREIPRCAYACHAQSIAAVLLITSHIMVLHAKLRNSTPAVTGLGNDFLIVDNRQRAELLLTAEEAKRLCDRRRGVGGDGIIFAMSGEQVRDASGPLAIVRNSVAITHN